MASDQKTSRGSLEDDPEALVNTIDSFRKKQVSASDTANNAINVNNSTSDSFDPIDFLNHHYKTEVSLINALPNLRSTINKRLTVLDDSISSTIQKQSDLADLTLSDVTRAKRAVHQLHKRVTTVQMKARQSEHAVQEITREMKRLDYAKKHLSKTITALKRLHMLLHAVKQLRYSVRECNPPDYKNAANLVDAVQLLLGNFRGYMDSVDKMRLLKDDVELMRADLNDGILLAFRVVGFGSSGALEKMERCNKKKKNDLKSNSTLEMVEAGSTEQLIMLPLPSSSLNDACNVLDALGPSYRKDFMRTFCVDHLEPYVQLFHPQNNTSAGGAGAASIAQKPSFKIMLTTEDKDEKENVAMSNPNPASLDQIERRYAWYRRMLRELDETFPTVFPKYWNMEYHMTHAFLTETAKHILLLFSSKEGSNKALRDRDCDNVSVLLKALQKTILFEKEMTAWLQREYGTQFDDESSKQKKSPISGKNKESLEFDENGKAVAAGSAEGIRIKYERQMHDRKKRAKVQNGIEGDNGDLTFDDLNRVDEVPVIVPPLIRVASNAFEKFMIPYIALEEQNMDEQLKESASDTTVDTRGELPVFTSSTNLFLYIKNSITRCTVFTKGKTLFLLYRAFQRTLRKYAKVLASKYPSALSGPAAAIGGISITGLTTGSGSGIKDIYKIPQGDETTICHIIDTCEYCSETVEALQDLIVDKIEDKYKTRIDMRGEEEAFHDVTAKGIRVLVSGLVHRTDQAFKGMYNINWSSLDIVGEESAYVRSMHDAIQPFVVQVKSNLPTSYFRNFCDQFAMFFTNAFYNTITRQKRISESGTQQLLLDVYNLKTLLLKIPVLEKVDSNRSSCQQASSSIAPAMYTKIVTKQFQRIEILLKLVGTPEDLLIDVFKAQWQGGSALDLQTVTTLKGMKRNDQMTLLEKFGVDPMSTMKSVSGINDNIQSLQDKSSDVAAKVNSDLIQMREKVERFRGAFR